MEQCATNVPRMFHNVYQRINDFRLLNKSPWNILFHAQQLLDLGVRNEELGIN